MSGNAGSKTPIGIFRAAPGDNGREPDSCVATAPNADVFPAAAAAISPPEAARKFLRLREQIVELRPMYSLRPALMLVLDYQRHSTRQHYTHSLSETNRNA